MHNQPREPQLYEDCQEKSIQEFGWTSQGMDWVWGQDIKSTTHRRVKEFGYSCHQRRLTWTKRRRTGLLPSGPKSSADQLFKDADFIFQQDLAPVHTAKSTKSWLNDHGVGVLDWPANSPDLNIENLWGIVKRKMRNKRPKKMQMSWRPLSKKPGLHTTSAVPQTDHLHATPNWDSN